MKGQLLLCLFLQIGLLVNAQQDSAVANPFQNFWQKATGSVSENSVDQEVQKEVGKLNITADARVRKIMDYRKSLLDSNATIAGFRVQIYSASGPASSAKAQEQMNQFIAMHEDQQINAYLVSALPYFKVRVGDFKTRLKATGFLNQIKTMYPNAFVVQDQINTNP